MIKANTIFSSLVILTVLFLSGWQLLSPYDVPQNLKKPVKMKGVCWDGGDSIQAQHIQTLEPYSVNWISLTPFGFQASYNSPEIRFGRSRGSGRNRDYRMAHTTRLAKEKGIKVMLKPHIWLRDHDGKWRSDIDMETPEAWQVWFAAYEKFILHHAQLAEEHQIESLCIGTELYLCTTQHETQWRQLIQKIRTVYSGQLTYAANFYKEYEEIQFWDALDYIGIQAYFPLTDQVNPSLKTLKKGWEPHFKKIKKIHKKWKKPVVFTEFGYRSSNDAAIHPWEWEERGHIDSTKISAKIQAICYDALFETFWQEDWIAGTFLWKWTRENYGPTHTQRRRRRAPSPFSFSPKQDGLKVLQKWYTQK